MKFRLILLFIFTYGLIYEPIGQTKKITPYNDPNGQKFRYTPMRKSTRSITTYLNNEIQLAFDTEKLRTHSVWKGKLDLFGPQYTHSKRPFIAQINGKVIFENPPFLPWQQGDPPFKPNLNIINLTGRFISTHTNKKNVTLNYQLRTRDNEKISISLKPTSIDMGLMRTITVSPHNQTLWFMANNQQESNDYTVEIKAETNTVTLHTKINSLIYSEINITETGSESEYEKNDINHNAKLYWVKIPPRKKPTKFHIINKFKNLSNKQDPPLKNPIKQIKPIIEENIKFLPRKSESHEFYSFEKLPLKKEWEMLVTGMDWLDKDRLAICTWTGSIYIVSGLTANNITVNKALDGLNEPMGLLQHNGKIYVSQKPELTEILINKSNNSTTLTQVSSDWGYSGHYNAFSYGPVLDRDGNFTLANAGHSGRWDMKFMGWGIKLNKNGTMSGISSGFREPNGIGTYGPNRDIFITDNQGHWTAVCELNHLRPNKYFGRPAATPDPKKLYKGRSNFTPPAVWFPYSLARSVSGISEIKDESFGPFKGQLLVGDFQNAIVTRVFLEKVKGEYQGAVFPFLKGFSSGVNRLSFGPNGKLYVGGLQKTWACVAPDSASLERVTYNGKTPFEILRIEAKNNGFLLSFTKPIKTNSADPENFDISQFRYAYHANYGSPRYSQQGIKNRQTNLSIKSTSLSRDRKSLHINIEGLKEGYVTEFRCFDIQNDEGVDLLHDTFHYTLNRIP